MERNRTQNLVGIGLAMLGLVLVTGVAWAGEFRETLSTPAINSWTVECTVTNVTDQDLRVVIRLLDQLGRTHNPAGLRPSLTRMSDNEVVRNPDGSKATELDMVLPPNGSDGVFRIRSPAGSFLPPVRCQVQIETRGAALVSYCAYDSDTLEITGCVQAP